MGFGTGETKWMATLLDFLNMIHALVGVTIVVDHENVEFFLIEWL